MRTTTISCERCGKSAKIVDSSSSHEDFKTARVQIWFRSSSYESGYLYCPEVSEVCNRCAEILRAMVVHQVRRWRLNADHYTDEQLAEWTEDE